MTPRHANKFMFFLLLYQMIASLIFAIIIITLRDYLGMNISFNVVIISSQIISFVIPFFIYIRIKRCRIRDMLEFKRISFINIVLIILLMLFVQPMMMLMSAISTLFFPNNVSTVMELLFTGYLPLLILTIAVTPAICEEIIFRGIISSGYKKVDLKTAAVINGLLFGIMHRDPQQFLYAFILGSVFYLLLHYTRSVWAPILAHFVINASQATLGHFTFMAQENAPMYAYTMSEMDPYMLEMMQMMEGNEIIIAIIIMTILSVVALPFFIGLFAYFVKYNKARGNVRPLPQDSEDESDIIDSDMNDDPPQKVVDIYLILTVVLFIISLIIF